MNEIKREKRTKFQIVKLFSNGEFFKFLPYLTNVSCLLNFKTSFKFIDEDLPLTLKHISVGTTGDGRHSGHLTLSQTSMLHKLEDLVEETEEAMSRKNTTENSTNIPAYCPLVNNVRLRNNDIHIGGIDRLSLVVTRRRSVPSNDVNCGAVQMTIRRQKSYPEINLGNKFSLI